jgi:hypothetical protein
MTLTNADLVALLDHVRRRPGMWLPDERYSTLVGFVAGIDVATGGLLLGDFSKWLAFRYLGRRSSVVWWGQVADQIRPELRGTGKFVGALDEEESARLNVELLDRLDEFLRA